MQTLITVFGVIANIVLFLAILSTIAGIVWIAFPLVDKIYITENIYYYSTPLGGRTTGIIILGFGVVGLTLGFLLDKEHNRLSKRFGVRT